MMPAEPTQQLLTDDERRVTIRTAHCGLFGTMVRFSREGACIELRNERPMSIGQWVVLAGSGLPHGYDACVVAMVGKQLHLAFDPKLAAI